MTFTSLIIIVGVGLGATKHTINFEDAWDCFEAMDNFYTEFYREQDRLLILPPVDVGCYQKGKKI
jgi:hypothetical protein|tara:strand:+ start:563 stop:757 length:195 start_codon:yes stop_codon:yes gene_type:complete